jgi:hypothetical protein
VLKKNLIVLTLFAGVLLFSCQTTKTRKSYNPYPDMTILNYGDQYRL